MFLIVGLGNPGKKYEKTRHNVGFRTIDLLKPLNLKGVVLAKPKTFMNQSGKEVKELINKFQIPNSKLIVVHDDIDIPLGKIRIVKNRGSAGHKGVGSVIKELGTKNFIRFRIGIKPKNSTFLTAVKNVEAFVLQKFTKEEEKIAKEVIGKTAKDVESLLTEGLEKAMNQYNK